MRERVLEFEEALQEVLRHAGTLRGCAMRERVPLLEALGHTLGAAVTAARDQPPFDRSTRDGFAIRAQDVTSGTSMRVLGTVAAGELWRGAALREGEAVEIMTGAPLPEGADAVLMVEHAERAGDDQLYPTPGRTLRAGENVVPRGAEAHEGAEVIPAGRRIGAAEIALAASCGCATLDVYERGKVAIVATGDELVELDSTPEAWQIFNSNSYVLRALVEEEGGFGGALPIARDRREDLIARIAQGSMWDLLILSGGVSMGKYDLVEDVLGEFGAEFFFTGAWIQPGKPVVFGRLPKIGRHQVDEGGNMIAGPVTQPWSGEWTYFFGLPGNPISTEVCFRLLASPMLRALNGRTDLAPRFVEATLADEIRGGARVTRFLPAVVESNWKKAALRVVPWQGSGDLAANARANAFVVLPTGVQEFHAGDTVRVLLR
jgi:molybdopterin molybdotransferase